jgi:hypothetical protein
MKCLTGRRELCLLNFNCEHPYMRVFGILAEVLVLFVLWTSAAGRQNFHLTICLWEENLGWIDGWGLNTDKLC